MKTCKPYRNLLALHQTAELSAEEQVTLDVHLQSCSQCRQALTELERVSEALSSTPLYQPEELLLTELRKNLSQKLQRQQNLPRARTWFFQPAFQIAFGVVLLAIGFSLGRFSRNTSSTDSSVLQQLLTAAHPIRTADGEIDPYIGEIEKVKYNSKSGMVDIQYHTINNISYRGNIQNPMVKQILNHAITEDQNPSTRLYAMKTMQAIALREQGLDSDMLTSIEYLLKTEENQGVRLLALRVLSSVPVNETIKNIMVRILLYDHNVALRIQAFESLSSRQTPDGEMENFLKSVKSDSSSYIRYRAKTMLKRMDSEKTYKSTSQVLSREG